MDILRLYCVLGLFLGMFSFAQNTSLSSYDELKAKFESFDKNDERALPYTSVFIKKAKKETNYPRLVEGYREALYYSAKDFDKLKYADSTIWAAKKTKDNDLISIAYLGKGIVYYSTLRLYKNALEEYLKAYQYAHNTKDLYLKNKIIYHLGVVKSYLGHYHEASAHFIRSAHYFKGISDKDKHPNEIFNNTKGYLNSIHQLAMCYWNQKQYPRADSLINIGLYTTNDQKDFLLERSYFLKCRGVSEFFKHKYSSSLLTLQEALPRIVQVDDYSSAALSYFYLGKNFWQLQDKNKAEENFAKVDSIFNTRHFILPELVENYKLLIEHYKNQNNKDLQLYYTGQLIKADSIIGKDFAFLSSTIYREYDIKSIKNKKEKLERSGLIKSVFSVFLILLTLVFIFLFIKFFRKERATNKYAMVIQQELSIKTNFDHCIERSCDYPEKKIELSHETETEILEKLKLFEECNGFIKKGLNLNKLATKLGTNTYYLSTVINEHKGKNFSQYLSFLRITYITNLLNTDSKFLSYTIEALAEECGMASRQNFSNLFFEVNGLRPKDFIARIKAESEKMR
ncbi:helix-turn-helix domain-containing protein [Elizabethkingia anophelis]|uniref:helix-turn-helix domain-containing protein n=1 Tax=Elizabethkingia anophelis TaxID=1117645 RepID=UPI000B35D322|nr:AraC family transcriptional regulator [Elizabethkingia anophelis]